MGKPLNERALWAAAASAWAPCPAIPATAPPSLAGAPERAPAPDRDEEGVAKEGERRTEPRIPGDVLRISQATLRPGCPVSVLDLSPSGAQVQSARPLRPGSRIHVRLTTKNHTLAVAALVVRCAVWALHPEDGVIYRGALRFEDECRSFWDEQASVACSLVAAPP